MSEEDGKPTRLIDSVSEEARDLIYNGNKIEAIKKVREETGLGLKDAKDFVERSQRELAEEDPNYVPPQRAGCGALIAISTTLAVMAKVAHGVLT